MVVRHFFFDVCPLCELFVQDDTRRFLRVHYGAVNVDGEVQFFSFFGENNNLRLGTCEFKLRVKASCRSLLMVSLF